MEGMNFQEAKDKLHKAGQEQVLRYYEELSGEQREALLKQIEDTDLFSDGGTKIRTLV